MSNRTGSIGQHVPRRPVLDALTVALEQADDEARDRLTAWLGSFRTMSWNEIHVEIERLRAFEAAERHRADMRDAFTRRQARPSPPLHEPLVVDGEEIR